MREREREDITEREREGGPNTSLMPIIVKAAPKSDTTETFLHLHTHIHMLSTFFAFLAHSDSF